jgi:hypothetical protein
LGVHCGILYVVVVLVVLCVWVGLEVDKGFGILMGLHVRSLYEGKETKIGSLLFLGSHKENRCPCLRGNVAIDGAIPIQHWCLLVSYAFSCLCYIVISRVTEDPTFI